MILEKNTTNSSNTLSKLSYQNPYHEISFSSSIPEKYFDTFINWLSGEFDLYLQEQISNRLTIFFPNGSIFIYLKKENTIIITVKNKNSNQCIDMMQKIIDFYNFYTSTKNIKH